MRKIVKRLLSGFVAVLGLIVFLVGLFGLVVAIFGVATWVVIAVPCTFAIVFGYIWLDEALEIVINKMSKIT
jgi:hypothetical protein